jgi:hypothetical protein
VLAIRARSRIVGTRQGVGALASTLLWWLGLASSAGHIARWRAAGGRDCLGTRVALSAKVLGRIPVTRDGEPEPHLVRLRDELLSLSM